MITEEERQIKNVIKKMMKKKSIDQNSLSLKLGVSLPTVRRILTKEKLTLDRLIEICRILEVKVCDLVSLATAQEEKHFFLSEDIEDFFSKQPHYYLYLRLLAQGLSPDEIEEECYITKSSSKSYLEKLIDLELISLINKNVKILTNWPPTFRFPGKLQKIFHKDLGETLVNHLAKKSDNDIESWGENYFYFIHSLRLTENHYKKCVQEYYELHIKYRQISKIDQETWHWRELVSTSAILGIDKFDPIEKVMGPIRNI